jgi:two-component sensor histidine kinase
MNALALVQAIVGLSRKDTAEAYAAAVRGRVQALARAHKILAESSWGAAPLAELICGEVGSYGGGRFSLEGPDVAIAPQLVQPIVLLLHELSVNASVHGAFGASEGGVKVSWRRGQEPDDIALRWEEHGGPPPAEVRASGFGTTILKALVERQLQGSWTAEWPATGLVLHLRFRNAEP